MVSVTSWEPLGAPTRANATKLIRAMVPKDGSTAASPVSSEKRRREFGMVIAKNG